jgi:uncharacterized FlaG/YvyC family protein
MCSTSRVKYFSKEGNTMDAINPIEGINKGTQHHKPSVSEINYQAYWKRQAQEEAPVAAADESKLNSGTDQRQTNAQSKHFPLRQTYAEFEVNQKTREVFVRIIDADSGELIRTLPPDKLAEEIAKGNLHPRQLRRKAVFA